MAVNSTRKPPNKKPLSTPVRPKSTIKKGKQGVVKKTGLGNNTPSQGNVIGLLADGVWLIAGIVAIMYALALASFSMTDPAWSRSIEDTGQLSNLTGLLGAYTADISYYFFGYSSWWIVLALCCILLKTFRSSRYKMAINNRYYNFPLAGFGILILLLSSPIVEYMLWNDSINDTLPIGAGGLWGQAITPMTEPLLGTSSGLLSLCFMVLGLSLLAQISWIDMCKKIGLLGKWISLKLFRAPQFLVSNLLKNHKIIKETEHITSQPVPEMPVAISNRKAQAPEPDTATEVAPSTTTKDIAIQTSLFDDEAASTPKQERKPKKTKEQNALAGDLPDLDLLDEPNVVHEKIDPALLQETASLIETKLSEFGVSVQVASATSGPVITRYEIEPAQGVKGSQIVNLNKDLARALSLQSVRVVETIAGKSSMGIELPNDIRHNVSLSEILSANVFEEAPSKLTVALGKDIAGVPVVADLAKMPHVLVAGTTGSGKSVAINTMILSLLYKASAEDIRLIMVDPKMLELSVYEDIPHLLTPVVTDMKQAANALNWCVAEMEKRYRLLAHTGVRQLSSFNQKIAEAKANNSPIPNPFSLNPDDPEPLEKMPFIVVIIDELADLMMVEGKKVEQQIARLAQKARAAGIHLILATQRPSVDVITGLIKANIPTRISFQVSSKIDSRTILDQGGAENLLGRGDMLFLPPGTAEPTRLHGAFVSDDEVHKVVSFLKEQGEPNYIEGLLTGEAAMSTESAISPGKSQQSDELFDQAVEFILTSRKTSISALQRHLRIGYNRSANLMEALEQEGIVSAAELGGSRQILAKKTIE